MTLSRRHASALLPPPGSASGLPVRLGLLLFLAGWLPLTVPAASPLRVAPLNRSTPVDFEREILPVLRANCLACHNQTKAKGDLILETPARILAGGSSGPGLVPGKAADSLVLRSAAHELEDLVMPPPGNKANARDLSPDELGLLALWINQGGRGEVRGSDAIPWSGMPTNWSPILALALSPDGRFAFASHAHRIDVYDIATREHAARIADPDLPDAAAHLDTVNALALSPDGSLLASGGYREVKLWRRLPLALTRSPAPASPLPRPASRPVDITPDGTLRIAAWKDLPPLTVGPVSNQVVLRAAMSPDGSRLAAALADGGVRLWTLSGTNAGTPVDLPGDPRAAAAVVASDHDLTLARAEVEFRKSAAARAAEERTQATNTLAKASDRHATNDRERTAKREALKAQKDTQAAATRERDEAAAALLAARQLLTNTTTAATNARTNAHTALRRAADERLASDRAQRAQSDLERAAQDLPNPSDPAALARARDLAERAAAEARERARASSESLAAADRALDDLQTASLAEGRARAGAERAEADLPAKIKGAGERLAAATKAVGELEGQLQKAEIAFGASEFDVGLSRTNADLAARRLDAARQAHTAAEAAVPLAEARLALSRHDADLAARRPAAALAFSPSQPRLATLDPGGRLQVWTLEGPAPQPLDALHDPSLAGADLAWPEPQVLECRFPDAVIRIALAPRWSLERTLGGVSGPSPLVDRVTALAFSPDGERLATGSGEPSRSGPIQVWRTAGGRIERDFGTPHSDTVLALAFSPDGDLLLSGGADRFLRLLDTATGTAIRQFEGHTHHVLGAAWRRDGRTVASAGADTVVKTWNRLTGERLKNIDGFGKEVTGIQAVGITDQFIAVSGSGHVRIFRENGEQIRTLPAGGAFLQALAVTPDGRLAAAGGDDGILRLWTLADGKVLAELPPPPATALSAR